MTEVLAQTLRTASVVRARVSSVLGARPAVSLGLAGFAAASLTVVAGGQIGTTKTVIPLSTWLGLMSRTGNPPGDYWPGILMLVGIIALVLTWVIAVRVFRPGVTSERVVWALATVWSLPFVIGPPLLSNDVYTYAAQGLMVRSGFNPYAGGPSVLGNIRAVAAVNPSWRSVPSPYGSLATLIEHLSVAISGGSAIGAVIVFRGLAVVCTVAIGLLAANLAGPRRVQALTLTVLNPLLLLQVVSAAHFEGIMCALLLGALVAANQRRWVLALALGCCAGEIKAPALVVVLAIASAHALGSHHGARLRVAVRDVLVAGASLAGLTFVVPHGLGWIGNLNTPGLGHTALAPASLLGDLYSPIVKAASFDDLSTGGRITALLAAGCAVLYLTATADRRAINRTAGYGLLAIGLLSPVLYPWYPLWAIMCLAPTARTTRRDWLVMASCLGCVFSPPGFNLTITTVLTIIAVGVALIIMLVRELIRRRDVAVLSAAG